MPTKRKRRLWTSRDIDSIRESIPSLTRRLTPEARSLLADLREYRVDCSVEHLLETVGTDFFPAVTLDAQHKRLLAAYREDATTAPVWSRLCNVGSASDFKLQRTLSANSFNDLDEVPELGEYPMDPNDDTARGTYRVRKYGKRHGISLEASANDELGAFGRWAQQFGASARRTLEKFVVATNLEANPTVYDGTALVAAGHNNYLGDSQPLSRATFKAAYQLMRKQTDETGVEIDIVPRTLIVHPDQEFTAREIVGSPNLVAAGSTTTTEGPMTNVLSGLVEVAVTPYVTSGKWWLAASPSEAALFDLGFFQGRQDPELFTRDTGESMFERDAMEWKVRHIYGGAWSCWRGIVGANFA